MKSIIKIFPVLFFLFCSNNIFAQSKNAHKFTERHQRIDMHLKPRLHANSNSVFRIDNRKSLIKKEEVEHENINEETKSVKNKKIKKQKK